MMKLNLYYRLILEIKNIALICTLILILINIILLTISHFEQGHHIHIEDEHTIEGYVIETNGNHKGITIYIDANYNGRLDTHEQHTITDNYGNFYYYIFHIRLFIYSIRTRFKNR